MSDLSPTTAVAAQRLDNLSRRGLLGKAIIAGLAATPVVGMLTSTSEAASPTQQTLDASSKEAFTDLRLHENDHVAFLKSALGGKARPKPSFKNLRPADFNAFVEAARVFEVVGVGAYLGALPVIKSPDYVAAAGAIALIEARHAGFLNVFAGRDSSTQARTNQPSAFDKPLTQQQVVNAAGPFIASLNGGPPASFKAYDDISILNFALLLEYLEAEFYNINIPRFFSV